MTDNFRSIILAWIAAGFAIWIFILLNIDPQFRLYYSNVVQTASALIAGIICMVTMSAFPSGSPLRKAWAFIGAGVLAWSIGSTIFAGYPILHEGAETPFPYYSDFFFLLTSPLIALGLYAFKRSTRLTAPLWGIALALVLLPGMGYWCYLANREGLAGDAASVLTALGYILFDPILLPTTVLVASSFRGGAVGTAWWQTVTGVALYFLSNQIYSFLTSQHLYTTGSWIDIGWVFGFGLIAWAGLTTRSLMR